jgi:hypothetical protein
MTLQILREKSHVQEEVAKFYKKVCPECNCEIVYSGYKSFYSASKRNSICKSCRTTRGNKSEKRKIQKENNPAWKGYKCIPGAFIKSYRSSSKKSSKKVWEISLENIYDLWISQDKKCKLTNVNIGWYDLPKNKHSCSVDRIDSSKGYTIDNVQLVHKDVNLMKNYFEQNYFIEMCKLVANNN